MQSARPFLISLAASAAVAMMGAETAAQVLQGDRITPPGGQVTTGSGNRAPRAPQIVAPGEGARAQPQVGTRSRTTTASGQVGTPGQPGVSPGQVTREGRSSGGSPQVANRDRSTQGSTALSTRTEGRQTSVAPLGGADRCDPQNLAAGVRCDRVIETRSAEFVRPAPPVLSPEQRLMLNQESAEMRSVRGAAQRAARNDIDVNSMETQALAAITLAPPATDPPAPVPVEATSEVLDAVVQIVTGLATGTPR